jgi:pyruvate formate lyase activating enzyme
MIKSIVCEIEKYATHDGPGIRSVVFLKGCPLTCLWCANPETQRKENELYYNLMKCIQCKRCIQACEKDVLFTIDEKIHIDREKCTACGQCVKECPMGALQLVGKEMNVEEVFEEVSKDMVFYQQSGGGITISGGEVLMHEEFAAALLQKSKENYINTAIETSGFGSWNSLFNIAEYCDVIMFDIKHTDENIHKQATGVDYKVIVDNLQQLSKLHNHIIIRVPLITGWNDSEENIENVVQIAKKNGIREIHLLPYHSLGREKYNRLDRKYSLEEIKSPEDIKVNQFKEYINNQGLKCIIGG